MPPDKPDTGYPKNGGANAPQEPEMPGSRDELGLTKKQRAALPILIAADTISKGINKIVDLGIISSRSYYYRAWNRDMRFRRVLDPFWREIHGELGERTRRRLEAYEEALSAALVSMALNQGGIMERARGTQLRAIEDAYLVLGINIKSYNRLEVTGLDGGAVESVVYHMPEKDPVPE